MSGEPLSGPEDPVVVADVPVLDQPFRAVFESFTVGEQWPNTVAVTTVAHHDPELAKRAATHPEEVGWAADCSERHLVQIDTNYKATRTGEHPVELTRADAVALAWAVLTAVANTFHTTQVGELRAGEAAELLQTLEDLDYALAGLRGHALADLLHRVGLNEPTTDLDPRPDEEG